MQHFKNIFSEFLQYQPILMHGMSYLRLNLSYQAQKIIIWPGIVFENLKNNGILVLLAKVIQHHVEAPH
jgi:hypothetical protein